MTLKFATRAWHLKLASASVPGCWMPSQFCWNYQGEDDHKRCKAENGSKVVHVSADFPLAQLIPAASNGNQGKQCQRHSFEKDLCQRHSVRLLASSPSGRKLGCAVWLVRDCEQVTTIASKLSYEHCR